MHYQQERYYQVLGMYDKQSDSTPFIEFMLENMVIALQEGMGHSAMLSEGKVTMLTAVEERILQLLAGELTLMAKVMALDINVSTRTVERYLKTLQQKGLLLGTGAKKGGAWQIL